MAAKVRGALHNECFLIPIHCAEFVFIQGVSGLLPGLVLDSPWNYPSWMTLARRQPFVGYSIGGVDYRRAFYWVCSKHSQEFRGSMGGVLAVGLQQAVGQVSVVEVSVEPFG